MPKLMGICPVCGNSVELNPDNQTISRHEILKGRNGYFGRCDGTNKIAQTIVNSPEILSEKN
jgi:hypothetical protein